MTFRCGYIALIGRPNVGKSSLLNAILGTKLSITSRKPQTTRHEILGIYNDAESQMIYVDTPGIHTKTPRVLNRMMNRSAYQVMRSVDVVAYMVEAPIMHKIDPIVLRTTEHIEAPKILVVNKIDKVSDKKALYEYVDHFKDYPFDAIVPISARTGFQVDRLTKVLRSYLPEGNSIFKPEMKTDKSDLFLCAELLREKIFRYTGEELPYSAYVEIESFKDEGHVIRIYAAIVVDKENHKPMIIGHRGQKLKMIGTQARLDMEKLLGKKVCLHCFCKVKSGWADDERVLGYAS